MILLSLTPFITMLLLGCSQCGMPFQDVFLISVALSLGAVLRLSDITPGGSKARVVVRNTRQKWDNKKDDKNHIIRVHHSWAVFVVDGVVVYFLSLFTFRYHFLLFSCYWRQPYPTFTLPYLISSYLSLPYILPYLTLPHILPFVTLPCTLPYLTSYIT